MKDFSKQKTFELEGSSLENYFFSAKFLAEVKIVDSVTLTDTDGTIYVMRSTPVVDLRFTYTTFNNDTSGVISRGNGQGFKAIYENVWAKFFTLGQSNWKLADPPERKISSYSDLRCLLDADIHTPYKDQFVVQRRR